VSRQAFQRKIGKKVRGFRNTCIPQYRICGISALGVPGTPNQLCIMDYMYRKAAGKNDYNNNIVMTKMAVIMWLATSNEEDANGL